LHAAIGNAPHGFRCDHLDAARFVQPEATLVKHPGTVPDGKPGDVHIHFVVGEHESDALVLTKTSTESLAPPRIVRRHVVRPSYRAEPPHAVREAGRRKANLRVLETFPHLSEHVGRGYLQIVEAHDSVAA
jgi:hypothetical protein